MAEATKYSRLQIGLHWIIAILIGINWLTGEDMIKAFDGAIEGTGLPGLSANSHIYLGLAIIALAVVRLVLRLVQGAPEAPSTGKAMVDMAGALAHKLLYVLMILVPVLGAIAWFKQIETIGDLHVLVMNGLMSLILIHVAAGLFHQFILKDNLLARMK